MTVPTGSARLPCPKEDLEPTALHILELRHRGNVLLASDASHYYEHWVKNVPFSICWSQPDLMTSYDKFEQLADSQDHVIPGHDPIVRDLYPAYSSATGDEVVRLDETPARSLKDVFPEA